MQKSDVTLEAPGLASVTHIAPHCQPMMSDDIDTHYLVSPDVTMEGPGMTSGTPSVTQHQASPSSQERKKRT